MFCTYFWGNASAAEMESNNYRVQYSSVNTGGRPESSANYKLDETIGELGTGLGQSANYKMKAGYQQMQESFISITEAADVTMAPAIPGVSGGTATGSAAWTVLTDNFAGYSLTIRASTAPALISGVNSFADYTTILAGTPDFTWQVAATDSEFGFTIEGADTNQKFLDNGIDCGIGGSDTSLSCWSSLSTSQTSIAGSATANQPTGTLSTVIFKAQSGASHSQVAGTYTATITVTATTL
ncbi:MAG: hypothetical protein A2445_05275 [Candidatus Jacksonbacteria bacterium RIFOXYC2_FULL_44_29]|nr:MAG: hypothetical protein UW45_C0034G0004 [Parcubacteria group bacterium GW2011_GWC2_44_22]OGY76901.1 MAG: hypothetical protein A2240_02085 [Candidatus Jacksonbacteria bacterium RIFOXYA2_FULL_43_12]OGY77126.1 MAG: hypothetical protein A2295_03495 [Candidatus Jacksonbacteria bacterium RIFOXYB2_FULL_44_15]OGY77241.1 MAG: hypothetical protein A2445_05275 [Candidatus Jacksonbacteria bacterium RIFOXYC2_FULL_44_29]OGY78419.1 MAG: hypothetical protein A2550_06390 [Candidatus Jacksonbacteria bacteri